MNKKTAVKVKTELKVDLNCIFV